MNDKQRRAMFSKLKPYPSRDSFLRMLESEKKKPYPVKPTGTIDEQNDPNVWTPTFDKYYHTATHAHSIGRLHGLDKKTAHQRAKSLELFARKNNLTDEQLTDLLDLYHKDKAR